MRDSNYRPLTLFRRGGDRRCRPGAAGTAAIAAILLVLAGACSHSRVDLNKPQAQDSLGVQMAKMNLWREAMFRFQRAVELNPGDAMAHNNLAVAYEANGDYEKAAKEYREALKLDRSNQYIQKNYSRYTEFMARNKKRQQRQEAKTASGPASKPGAAPSAAAAPVMIPPSKPEATPPPGPAGSAALTPGTPAAASGAPVTTTAPAAAPANPPSTGATPQTTPAGQPPATSTAPLNPPTTPPATSTAPQNPPPPATTTAPQTPPPPAPPTTTPPPQTPQNPPANPPGGAR